MSSLAGVNDSLDDPDEVVLEEDPVVAWVSVHPVQLLPRQPRGRAWLHGFQMAFLRLFRTHVISYCFPGGDADCHSPAHVDAVPNGEDALHSFEGDAFEVI